MTLRKILYQRLDYLLNLLLVVCYFVGLRDPFFVKPKAWGNRIVMDIGAVWAGPPSGSYKIGKTFVQNIGNQLKMTTYMSDGVTKLENIIDIPNC